MGNEYKVVIAVLAVFAVILIFSLLGTPRDGYYGCHGCVMMSPYSGGSYGHGSVIGIFMMIFWLALIIAVILGIFWLIKNLNQNHHKMHRRKK